jgi:hypothetical protein
VPGSATKKERLYLHNWLEAHILRREAEASLGGRPTPGKP